MAVATSVVMLAVAIFLLRLTGQGLLSHTAMTSMARYFDEERGIAMSVTNLGHPAGEAVLPVLAVLVRDAIGWQETWLRLAGVVVIAFVPLAVLLLRGHDARHAAYVDGLAGATPGGPSAPDEPRGGAGWNRAAVLRDPRFYGVLPAAIAPGFIVTGVFFHQGHLVDVRGWSEAMFAASFAAFAATQVPSGLIGGVLVDRFGARRLATVFLLPLVASLVVLTFMRHGTAAPVFMALAGVTAGLSGVVTGALWAELYGTRHLGAIRAMVSALGVFGTAASPVLMGWMIDAGVTMSAMLGGAAVYAAVASGLATMALNGHRRPEVSG